MSSTDRFKFRVWDYDAGEYINDGALLDGRTGRISGNGKYAIEQCTGICDKNGKLIYEGDIVRCDYGGRSWTYTICYDPQLAGLYYNAGGADCSESFDVFYFSPKEIIGNIHEVHHE